MKYLVFRLVMAAVLSLAITSAWSGPSVLIATSLGDITLELDEEKAPLTVANFLSYIEEGHYNGTIFHRVMKDFMIQGGGFTVEMQRKDFRDPIQNEADNGLKNDRGTIAMARTMEPHSASAQFFINQVNNDFLNFQSKDVRGWGYAVFGKVTSGMEVVDQIADEPVGNGPDGMENVPKTPIVISSVSVISATEKEQAK